MVNNAQPMVKAVLPASRLVQEGQSIKWDVVLNRPSRFERGVRILKFDLIYKNGASKADIQKISFSNSVKLINGYLHIPLIVQRFSASLLVKNDTLYENVESVIAKFGPYASAVNIQLSDPIITNVTRVTTALPQIVEGQEAVWTVTLSKNNRNKMRRIPFDLIFSKTSNANDLGRRTFSGGVKQDKRVLIIPPNITEFTVKIAISRDSANENRETVTAKFGSVASIITIVSIEDCINTTVSKVAVKKQKFNEGGTIKYTVSLSRANLNVARKIPFQIVFTKNARAADIGGLKFSSQVVQTGSYLIIPRKIFVFDTFITIKNDTLFENNEIFTVRFGTKSVNTIILESDKTTVNAINTILNDLIISKNIKNPSKESDEAYRFLSKNNIKGAKVAAVMQHYRSYHYFGHERVKVEFGKIRSRTDLYFNNARLLMALDLNVPSAQADVDKYIGNVVKFVDDSFKMLKVLAESARLLFEPVSVLLGKSSGKSGSEPIRFANKVYVAPIAAIANALNNDQSIKAGGDFRSGPYLVTLANGGEVRWRFDYAFYTSFSEYMKKTEQAFFKAQTNLYESIATKEANERNTLYEKLISIFIAIAAFAGIGVNNFIGAPLSYFSDLIGSKLTDKKGKLTDKGVGETLKVSGGASAGAAGVIAVSERLENKKQTGSIADQIKGLSFENQTSDLDQYYSFLNEADRARIVDLKQNFKKQQIKLLDRTAQLALEMAYTVYEASGGKQAPFEYRKENHFDIVLPTQIASAKGLSERARRDVYQDWLLDHLPDYRVGTRFQEDLTRELRREGNDGILGQHVVGITGIEDGRVRGWTVDWFAVQGYAGWRVQQGTISL